MIGIGLGLIVPLIAVVAGIIAIKSNKKKGLGAAGLIMGIIAAVIGIVLTLSAAATVEAAADLASSKLGASLNDPARQDALKQGIEEALKDTQ